MHKIDQGAQNQIKEGLNNSLNLIFKYMIYDLKYFIHNYLYNFYLIIHLRACIIDGLMPGGAGPVDSLFPIMLFEFI